MELTKQKFKKTEGGMIPEDWEVISLVEIFDFKNGLNKESKYFGFGTPIINYMDVFKFSGITKDNIIGKVSLNNQEINAYSAKLGDVFFTRTSETQHEIGIASVLLEKIPNCVFSGFVLRGRLKSNKMDFEFFKYCFSPHYIRRQIISSSSYTTRALTNGRNLSKVKLLFPKLKEEQRAIATALSDVDELISNLENLIQKKKAIKQGAMQQLLTPPHKGGKRLEGFSGEWEEVELGNYIKLQGGFPFASSDFKVFGIPIIRISNIQTNAIDTEGCVYSKNYLIPQEFQVLEGDTLIAMSGATTGKIGVYKMTDKAYINQRVGKFVVRLGKMDFSFVKHLSRTNRFENELKKQIAQGAQPNISGKQIESFYHDIPKDIEEQKAIANKLSHMDLELEQLEVKYLKYKQIKKGMMQELLLGKTRLI